MTDKNDHKNSGQQRGAKQNQGDQADSGKHCGVGNEGWKVESSATSTRNPESKTDMREPYERDETELESGEVESSRQGRTSARDYDRDDEGEFKAPKSDGASKASDPDSEDFDETGGRTRRDESEKSRGSGDSSGNRPGKGNR